MYRDFTSLLYGFNKPAEKCRMDTQYRENAAVKSLRVAISGDCDMYNAPELLTALLEKMSQGYLSVFLDFSGVAYLDSSGVGVIIKLIKYAKEKKVDLQFRGIQGTPRRVLKMSNILSLITEEQ
jgi:anti-sigma B factor antagonist